MAKIEKQQPAIDVINLEFADWRDRDGLITFEDGETERHLYAINDSNEILVSDQPMSKRALLRAHRDWHRERATEWLEEYAKEARKTQTANEAMFDAWSAYRVGHRHIEREAKRLGLDFTPHWIEQEEAACTEAAAKCHACGQPKPATQTPDPSLALEQP